VTRADQTNWPQQAGILCSDPQFQRFVAARMRHILGDLEQVTATVAAEYLRRFCNITSRRDLATNIDARARLRILRTEFDAWSGRIAKPR
jgi:hypothetical protein